MGWPEEDQVRRSGGQMGCASRHTSPEGAPGSGLLQQAGWVARGLQLGQPLLHAAEVAVEPPGSAELGQTVLLVGQQGALWGVQGAEGHLQGDQSVEEETGPACQSPSPARVRKLLWPGCTSCWGSQDGVRTTDAGGRWGTTGILRPGCQLSLLGWFFPLRYILCLFIEHSVLCVCNEAMGL